MRGRAMLVKGIWCGIFEVRPGRWSFLHVSSGGKVKMSSGSAKIGYFLEHNDHMRVVAEYNDIELQDFKAIIKMNDDSRRN